MRGHTHRRFAVVGLILTVPPPLPLPAASTLPLTIGRDFSHFLFAAAAAAAVDSLFSVSAVVRRLPPLAEPPPLSPSAPRCDYSHIRLSLPSPFAFSSFLRMCHHTGRRRTSRAKADSQLLCPRTFTMQLCITAGPLAARLPSVRVRVRACTARAVGTSMPPHPPLSRCTPLLRLVEKRNISCKTRC